MLMSVAHRLLSKKSLLLLLEFDDFNRCPAHGGEPKSTQARARDYRAENVSVLIDDADAKTAHHIHVLSY